MDDHDALKGVVDKSGFPLQIGVSHLINTGTKSHGWCVQYSEHAWRNDADDNAGFIDLVLENKTRQMALVVECKRVQDTSWVFLNPQANLANRRYAKAWVSRYGNGKVTEFGWVDHPLDPESRAGPTPLNNQARSDKCIPVSVVKRPWAVVAG
jgi:hypothetical protein